MDIDKCRDIKPGLLSNKPIVNDSCSSSDSDSSSESKIPDAYKNDVLSKEKSPPTRVAERRVDRSRSSEDRKHKSHRIQSDRRHDDQREHRDRRHHKAAESTRAPDHRDKESYKHNRHRHRISPRSDNHRHHRESDKHRHKDSVTSSSQRHRDSSKSNNHKRRESSKADNRKRRESPKADNYERRASPKANDHKRRESPKVDNHKRRVSPKADNHKRRESPKSDSHKTREPSKPDSHKSSNCKHRDSSSSDNHKHRDSSKLESYSHNSPKRSRSPRKDYPDKRRNYKNELRDQYCDDAMDPLTRATKLASNVDSNSGKSRVERVQKAQDYQAAELVRNAEKLTGITLPKFYKPSAINPMKFAATEQKRKLLWSQKIEPSEENKSVWNVTSVIASRGDDRAAAKFKKLMGIHDTNTEPANHNMSDLTKKAEEQEELFRRLDADYQSARNQTHTSRGVGLGYNQTAYIDPSAYLAGRRDVNN